MEKELSKVYNPAEVEDIIQKSWKENNSYKATPSKTKEKFYCLSMFPYPSGSGSFILCGVCCGDLFISLT